MKAFEPGFFEDQLYKVEDLVQESVVRWESLKRFHWVTELRQLTSRIAGTLLFADTEGGEAHARYFEDIIEAITALPLSMPASKLRMFNSLSLSLSLSVCVCVCTLPSSLAHSQGTGEKARDHLFKWYNTYAHEVLHGERGGLEIGRLLRPDERARQISIDSAVRELHHVALSIYGLHNTLAFLIQAISQHAGMFYLGKK